MEFTLRFLGSFIPVSGKFGERLRPGAEPLGPVNMRKSRIFCIGGCDVGKELSRAPRDAAGSSWGPRHTGGSALASEVAPHHPHLSYSQLVGGGAEHDS